MKITREEHLEAVKEGVKEAFLTAMEAGDGYTGMIILEPILYAIEKGTRQAIYDIEESREEEEISTVMGKELKLILEELGGKIENLSENLDGLTTEIYKYRKDQAMKDPKDTRIWTN